jgi:hypothetical protein
MSDEIKTGMTEQEYKTTMTVVELVALKEFDNSELAAFNIAVQLYGKVAPENLAFKKALDFRLIKEDGYLWDIETIRTACAIEVNERSARGEW